MQEIEFSRWLFELPAKQHSQFSPSGSTFLHCLGLPSKSHCENSISSIFLESPHQVDVKNIVKCWKDFLCYFTTLETYRVCIEHYFKHRLCQKSCRLVRNLFSKHIEVICFLSTIDAVIPVSIVLKKFRLLKFTTVNKTFSIFQNSHKKPQMHLTFLTAETSHSFFYCRILSEKFSVI